MWQWYLYIGSPANDLQGLPVNDFVVAKVLLQIGKLWRARALQHPNQLQRFSILVRKHLTITAELFKRIQQNVCGCFTGKYLHFPFTCNPSTGKRILPGITHKYRYAEAAFLAASYRAASGGTRTPGSR